MKIKRIVSMLLTILCLTGCLHFVLPVEVAAKDRVNPDGTPIIKYTSQPFATPEAKLKEIDELYLRFDELYLRREELGNNAKCEMRNAQ